MSLLRALLALALAILALFKHGKGSTTEKVQAEQAKVQDAMDSEKETGRPK